MHSLFAILPLLCATWIALAEPAFAEQFEEQVLFESGAGEQQRGHSTFSVALVCLGGDGKIPV